MPNRDIFPYWFAAVIPAFVFKVIHSTESEIHYKKYLPQQQPLKTDAVAIENIKIHKRFDAAHMPAFIVLPENPVSFYPGPVGYQVVCNP